MIHGGHGDPTTLVVGQEGPLAAAADGQAIGTGATEEVIGGTGQGRELAGDQVQGIGRVVVVGGGQGDVDDRLGGVRRHAMEGISLLESCAGACQGGEATCLRVHIEAVDDAILGASPGCPLTLGEEILPGMAQGQGEGPRSGGQVGTAIHAQGAGGWVDGENLQLVRGAAHGEKVLARGMDQDFARSCGSDGIRHRGKHARAAIQAEGGDDPLAAHVDELAAGIHSGSPRVGPDGVGHFTRQFSRGLIDLEDRQRLRVGGLPITIDHEEEFTLGVAGHVQGEMPVIKGGIGQFGQGARGLVEREARHASTGIGHIHELAGVALDGDGGGLSRRETGIGRGRQGVGRGRGREHGKRNTRGDRDVAGGDHARAREGEHQLGTLPCGDGAGIRLEGADGGRCADRDGDGVVDAIARKVRGGQGVGGGDIRMDHRGAATGDRTHAVVNGRGAADEAVGQGGSASRGHIRNTCGELGNVGQGHDGAAGRTREVAARGIGGLAVQEHGSGAARREGHAGTVGGRGEGAT